VASSLAAAQKQAKGTGRAPLSRLSSNVMGSNRAAPDRLSKKASTRGQVSGQVQHVQLKPFHYVDITIGDKEDPQDVADYESFIYRTMRQRDEAMEPLRFEQRSITIKHRNVLIDAICRYHYKLGMTTSTLYRFVGILDRFLSVEEVTEQNLKLYGCAAFLIASKIEDIRPTEARDLVHLAERKFTVLDLLTAERHTLNAIKFETTFATPLFYLTHFMRMGGETKPQLLQARYILAICQTHERFHGVAPSLTASVALFVVRALHDQPKWPPELAGYTAYSEELLSSYASVVYAMVRESDREETRFIRRKYGSDLFLGVAAIQVPDHLV
jgi:hypothetical protein